MLDIRGVSGTTAEQLLIDVRDQVPDGIDLTGAQYVDLIVGDVLPEPAGSKYSCIRGTHRGNVRVIVDGNLGHTDWRSWDTAQWGAVNGLTAVSLTGPNGAVQFTPNGTIQGVKNAIALTGDGCAVYGSRYLAPSGKADIFGLTGDAVLLMGDRHIFGWTVVRERIDAKNGIHGDVYHLRADAQRPTFDDVWIIENDCDAGAPADQALGLSPLNAKNSPIYFGNKQGKAKVVTNVRIVGNRVVTQGFHAIYNGISFDGAYIDGNECVDPLDGRNTAKLAIKGQNIAIGSKNVGKVITLNGAQVTGAVVLGNPPPLPALPTRPAIPAPVDPVPPAPVDPVPPAPVDPVDPVPPAPVDPVPPVDALATAIAERDAAIAERDGLAAKIAAFRAAWADLA